MLKPSRRAGALLVSSLLLAGSLLRPPAAHADGAPPSVAAAASLPTQAFTLPNGLRVFLAPDAAASRATVRVAIDAGSKDDPRDARGTSEVIERLLADPSTRHVPREMRASLFAALGISEWRAEVTASFDATEISVTVPPSDVALALWFESDRLAFFGDGADDDEVMRKAAAVTPAGWNSWPTFRAGRAALLGDDHPYGGNEDLAHLRPSRVREQIKKYYGPRSTAVAVAGNFDPKAVKEQIEEMFGPLVDTPKPSLPTASAPALSDEKRIRVEAEGGHTGVGMVWATPAYMDPEDVLFDGLGSILAARLEADHVQGSKAASTVSTTQASMRLGSVFHVEMRAAPGHSSSEMELLVEGAIEKLRREGPTAAEVTRVSRMWLTNKLALLTRTANQAYLLTTFSFAGREMTFLPQLLGRYEGMSAAALRSAAEKYLGKSRRVTVTLAPRVSMPASGPRPQGGGA